MKMKCLDTYALVELSNNNPKFVHLLTEEAAIPDTTMAEFYGFLYKKYNLQTAEYWNRRLSILCKPVSKDALIKAVLFKKEHKKQNFSYFDCFGYFFALEHKMMFVTGDREFRQMSNVEFVK